MAKKTEDQIIEEVKDAVLEIKNIHEKRLEKLETASDRLEVEQKKIAAFSGGQENKSQTKGGRFKYEVKSDEDKAFFDTYLRKGMAFLGPEEIKTLILADDPAAGYLASHEYGKEIIKAITEFSPIRAEAKITPTTAKDIEFPKRSALPDTHWVSEIAERVEDESLDYKMEKMTPFEMISFKKVGLQQLEDSEFNLAEELGEAFAEAFGLKEGTGFVAGNSVGQPEGFLTNPDVGSTPTIAAGVIGPNDIMGFPYLIGRGYRANGKWFMNDVTMALIRLMRADAIAPADGLGPFLWQNSLIQGEPPTLAGYPVVSCPDMPDVATGTFPIVFGDMRRAYMIADRVQISVQVLRERYAEFGIVGYLARKRVDGQVVLPAAIRKLEIAAA